MREVKEETGISVKNIRYFGSEPWPFPDSLMVGFTADFAGGELVVDKTEIESAFWFDREHLPRIPEKISISRALIDWWMAQSAGSPSRVPAPGEKAYPPAVVTTRNDEIVPGRFFLLFFQPQRPRSVPFDQKCFNRVYEIIYSGILWYIPIPARD